jgi:RNA polymerase sigma-70 factor, ECF subfamily
MKNLNELSSMVNNNFDLVENPSYVNDSTDSMTNESEMDELFNISDNIINFSLNALDNSSVSDDPSTAFIKKVRAKSKTKKSIRQIADEVVTAYLCDKSDKNWQNLQEFFWYGIRQFAFKYVKNLDDAYDMTIETFINAHNKIDSYDPSKAKFSTWLWIICRNNCLGFLREQGKKNIVDNDISSIYDSAMLSAAYDPNDTDYVTNNNDYDDPVKSLYDISLNEMKNIGGVTQQILEMKLIKDMKIREIADELNMNESTVKNYLYKGKTNLAKILQVNHKDSYEAYIEDNHHRDEYMYM